MRLENSQLENAMSKVSSWTLHVCNYSRRVPLLAWTSGSSEHLKPSEDHDAASVHSVSEQVQRFQDVEVEILGTFDPGHAHGLIFYVGYVGISNTCDHHHQKGDPERLSHVFTSWKLHSVFVVLQSPPHSRPSSAQGGTAPVAASFSKPTTVLKIRPPAVPTPCHASNSAAALKSIDGECSVIGSGVNHVLLPQYFQHSDATFGALHEAQLQHLKSDEQSVTWWVSRHVVSVRLCAFHGIQR